MVDVPSLVTVSTGWKASGRAAALAGRVAAASKAAIKKRGVIGFELEVASRPAYQIRMRENARFVTP
jgi:ketopantoate hydroxymethyltransferase